MAKCKASTRAPEMGLTLTAFCDRERDHEPPHVYETITYRVTWESGEDPVITGKDEPSAPEPTRATVRRSAERASTTNVELQSAFERLRALCLEAAHHLRNLPAMPEGSDVKMAERLEDAAAGE